MVLIPRDCSGFLNVDSLSFVSSSGFLCISYNFYGIALDF